MKNLILIFVADAVVEARKRELSAIPSGGDALLDRVQVELFSDMEALLSVAESRPVSAIVIDNRENQMRANFSESVAGKALPEILSRVSASRAMARSAILVVLPEFEATATLTGDESGSETGTLDPGATAHGFYVGVGMHFYF